MGCGSSLTLAQTPSDINMTLRPRLCVMAQGETLCKDEIYIRWEAPLDLSLCLYSAEQYTPLECWQNAAGGEYRTWLEAAHDIEFTLKAVADSRVLARQAFEVVRDDRRYRRKRRNPWSFF